MGWPFPDNDDHLQELPRYVCGLHYWADDYWPCDLCEDERVDEIPAPDPDSARGRAWAAYQQRKAHADHR